MRIPSWSFYTCVSVDPTTCTVTSRERLILFYVNHDSHTLSVTPTPTLFLPLYAENYETDNSHFDLAATQHGPTGDTKPSASSTKADEFLSFAKWAFSSDGLPSLQVLGFGDFSHGTSH